MQKTYTAARIDPEAHRPTLGRLWRDNLAPQGVSDELVEQRMRWFLNENPAGPTRTWMGFQGPDREVIGSGSFYMRDTVLAGRTLKAGILGDFAVDRAHRIAGAAMSIQREIARAAREAGVDFLYAFPNRAAFPIFQRAGYKKIGESTMWVKPLTAAYKVEELAAGTDEDRRGAAREIVQRAAARAAAAIPSARWRALWEGALPLWLEDRLVDALDAPEGPLARAAVRAADAGLVARDSAQMLRRRRRVDSELAGTADLRFDDLWARARHRYIVGVRSSAYLNWRYTTFKTTDYRFFCLTDPSRSRLLGYAVYRLQGNKAVVADLFCEDLDELFELLILKLAERMRQEGYDALCVLYVGASIFGERLRRIGFFPRPQPKDGSRWLIVHMDAAFPEELRREALDPERWFMPDGELDA